MALIFIIVYFNFDSLPQYSKNPAVNNQQNCHFFNIERLAIWSASIQMIKEHPLVGVGIDNWRYYYLLPEYMQSINTYPHAHNFYLQTGSEMGVTGLISIFLCLP